MDGDFLELLRVGKRQHEATGNTSSNAYEDEEGIHSTLLSSSEEEAILPPEEPSEEDERVLLGELPTLPAELTPPKQEEEYCLTILESIIDNIHHFAPAPIGEDFEFFKPVQECGELYDVYRAMKLALIDKKTTTITLDGAVQSVEKNQHGVVRIPHASKNLAYVSEDPSIQTEGKFGPEHTFFWVMGTRSHETLGYCLEGWVYKAKSRSR